jgi:hypothetical protein
MVVEIWEVAPGTIRKFWKVQLLHRHKPQNDPFNLFLDQLPYIQVTDPKGDQTNKSFVQS